ncbi:unnamed protein product [marine sediment metagenome]|uniref:Uncharacterized protein n=1 Tax=marine sediment metagenome TaxID=412755 RepID=X1T7I0_9ZZZZ
MQGGRATKGNSDTKIAYDKIARFLADKLAKTDAEHWTPRLITDVKEISRHTEVDERVVKTYLSKREGELVDKGIALVRVGKTYAVIKLANPHEGR